MQEHQKEKAKAIAREIGEALANSEDFILFCYWAEILNNDYLEELYFTLEKYISNEEWKAYRKTHT